MKRIFGIVLLVVVVVLVYVLDHPIGAMPAIGRLIDPVNGCWANAEPVNEDFSANLKLKGVANNVTVWFDEQLVPHVHAANAHDVYFIEGYIHACFRLWQIDMETRAAAGRVSEVVGDKALKFDRKQRRKGMGYGAENSLRAMEADPRTKEMMDAYTEGINNYIASLNYRHLPLEYKLMGFAPEKWTNLKTALLLKYMADDLTGKTDDIAMSYLRDVLPKEELDLLFPDKVPGSSPVIPKGTVFEKPSLSVPVAPPDSIAFPHFKAADFGERHEDGKGSNNWVLSGSRTASGAPILCNDPHLGLNLPSLWYEIQLQAPGLNVYGASLPGTPGVIIGFNDSLTWGFTNNYRDVKDYYLIKPVAENRNKYWFSGKQLDYTKRVEHILVKGKPEVIDTVNYTIHGPVMYDEHFSESIGMKENLAVCWMAHRATNEMLAIYLMNRAGNYNQFVDGILNFQCPAQNMAYADRAGNIAVWGQGQFVNKWKDQGKYVMNGSDSSTLWGQLIPMRENPHVLNPAQGYVASANQSVTDDTYPYWYNGSGFVELRAWRINQVLSGTQKATVEDMFKLQNDTYSWLAAGTLPLLLKDIDSLKSPLAKKYRGLLSEWDYRLGAASESATFFQIWWNFLSKDKYEKIFSNIPNQLWPLQERTMQLLQTDKLYKLNIELWDQTKPYELSGDHIPAEILIRAGEPHYLSRKSFEEAIDSIKKFERKISAFRKTDNPLKWYYAKNTTVSHLAKIPAFSYDHLKIGGWGNTVNAAKSDHGPSWRMVVQMGKEIEAYGVYPGGQSGNPGSKYYGNFIQNWVDGKYFKLLFLPIADKQENKSIKYVWTVKGG